MSDPDDSGTFEDKLRALAEELTRSFERISEVDIESWTRTAGLDPERGLEWLQIARGWLAEQAQGLARPTTGHPPPAGPHPESAPAGSAPHPLDLPTDEQGAALAALDSGRWALEPGTTALSVIGDGPGPTDALGLVRTLRIRDWLRADGTPTLAGQRALERWLAAAS
jgi:hypothetical protein